MQYNRIIFIDLKGESPFATAEEVKNIAESLGDSFKFQDVFKQFEFENHVHNYRAADKLLQRMRKKGLIKYQTSNKTWHRI